MPRALARLSHPIFWTLLFVETSFAQQALTWNQLRDRFEATNPTLIAARIGIDDQQDYRSVRVNYLNLIGSYLTSAAQMNFAAGREVIQ